MRKLLLEMRLFQAVEYVRQCECCDYFITRQRLKGSINWAVLRWSVCASECDYANRCQVTTIAKVKVPGWREWHEYTYSGRVVDTPSSRKYAKYVVEKIAEELPYLVF